MTERFAAVVAAMEAGGHAAQASLARQFAASVDVYLSEMAAQAHPADYLEGVRKGAEDMALASYVAVAAVSAGPAVMAAVADAAASFETLLGAATPADGAFFDAES